MDDPIYNGIAVAYIYKVQNDGNTPDSFTLTGPASNSQWTIHYFIAGIGDITEQMTSAGLKTCVLNPGAFCVMWATIQSNAGANDQQALAIQATSNGDSSRRDLAQAHVTVTAIYQPDLKIRLMDERLNTGNNIYTLDGVDQSKSQAVKPDETTTYIFSIQNDGSFDDSFTLTAPAGNGAWTVHYYAASLGEITAQITGAGWSSGTLEPGAVRGFWATVTPNSAVLTGNTFPIAVQAVSTRDSAKKDRVNAVSVAAVP